MQRESRGQWRRRLHKAQVVLALLLPGIAAAILVFWWIGSKQASTKLIVFLQDRPQSLDPADFNATHLQPLQSIINIKLFTGYRDAKTTPQLVKAWTSSASFTDWTFEIRDDVYFSDGAKVTASEVVKSLKRIAFLSKKKNARIGFSEYLLGIESLRTADSREFSGIAEDRGKVHIKLKRPVANLPELLSFGLFGIVKSSYFDPETGRWEAPSLEAYAGAGPYRYLSCDAKMDCFVLRSNYPSDLRSASAFQTIVFDTDKSKKFNADLFVGTEDLQVPSQYLTFRSAGETKIIYFLIHSWALGSGPMGNIELRRILANEVEKNLRARKINVKKSFFPMLLPGVQEVVRSSGGISRYQSGSEISFVDFRPMSVSVANDAVDSLELAIKKIGFIPKSIKHASYVDAQKNKNYFRKKFDFDIGLYSTDMSMIDPSQDIKLMFSKSGLGLPDIDGSISSELRHEGFSIQHVNELIISQAAVIPVVHKVQGLWARDNLDFSNYSSMLLLGDLQWIGSKRVWWK